MLYARKLRKGDRVAIVSLSSGMLGEDFCSHIIEIGVKRLKEYGLEPIFMPNSLKGIEYLKEHPEARANDLKQAFNMIYSIMQETSANEMIQKMNRQFGCFRALSFVFILETVISTVLLIRQFFLEGFNLGLFKIFIPLVIISWLSIRRMYRFGNRFADYCYRNYAKD